MHVIELWRHPVKSLQGERLGAALVGDGGVEDDRAWGIRDTATGKILTGRREAALLLASSRATPDGVEVKLPDGTTITEVGAAANAALSGWLGRPVELVTAADVPPHQAEAYEDATDDTSTVHTWTLPEGRFVDLSPVLVITTASLRRAAELYPDGEWDVRRFRPNILVEADGVEWLEDAWCGRDVHIGEVVVRPFGMCTRCTMVTRPQPDLERDLDIFRTLAREHAASLGVWAGVTTSGTIREGDAVTVD